MAAGVERSAYWSRPAVEVADELESGPAGLTSAGVAAQRARAGPNAVEDRTGWTPLQLLLRQFVNPLVLILVIAATISLVLRQWIDAGIVLAIVLGSSLLSFFQEFRASSAVAQLSQRIALMARVVRDGAEQVVPVTGIVPGDVVLLSAGNLVPADGIVIEAQDFLVSEASITGESFPVEKRPGIVHAEAALTRRTNSVFLGSSVRSGTARILVVQTGLRTEFGAIADRLRTRQPETEFARGVRTFGALLIRIMVVIVLAVLTVNVAMGRPAVESLLFAAALAVGLSPELLPAIISVTLSAGARAMAGKGVIVRRLDAIENLGSMTVLCTDKTGTLTEGTIVLREALDCTFAPSDAVLELAFLNARFETGIDNPLDTALITAGVQAGLSSEAFAKIDEIPYDFVRRRLTIVLATKGSAKHEMITKGAFAEVLETCAFLRDGDADIPLDEGRRSVLEASFRERSAEGFRVLALATRTVVAKVDYDRADEAQMTFRGFLVFQDPPRQDAARTIADLGRLGIAIKVISGDNRFVTAHVARAVGLSATAILTGEQIGSMRDEALWHMAPRTDLFVEIDPQQKERIVRALQRTGHSVGYLGDGINDAPALHTADVGISVAEAVDVARDSADIVLTSRDLGVLREGVEGGRRTFANTLKYIAITTSANFGNMISMALVTPFLPFLPLAAKQILLNNFLSDLPSIAISGDNVDPERLSVPQRWNIKDIKHFMVVFGLVSSAFDLLTFGVLIWVLDAGEAQFQTVWFMISLLTELAIVLVLRTRRPVSSSRPGRMLLWSTAAVMALTFTVPWLGPLGATFGFVALSAGSLTAILAILLAYVSMTEVVKRWFFRSGANRPGGHAPSGAV